MFETCYCGAIQTYNVLLLNPNMSVLTGSDIYVWYNSVRQEYLLSMLLFKSTVLSSRTTTLNFEWIQNLFSNNQYHQQCFKNRRRVNVLRFPCYMLIWCNYDIQSLVIDNFGYIYRLLSLQEYLK